MYNMTGLSQPVKTKKKKNHWFQTGFLMRRSLYITGTFLNGLKKTPLVSSFKSERTLTLAWSFRFLSEAYCMYWALHLRCSFIHSHLFSVLRVLGGLQRSPNEFIPVHKHLRSYRPSLTIWNLPEEIVIQLLKSLHVKDLLSMRVVGINNVLYVMNETKKKSYM